MHPSLSGQFTDCSILGLRKRLGLGLGLMHGFPAQSMNPSVLDSHFIMNYEIGNSSWGRGGVEFQMSPTLYETLSHILIFIIILGLLMYCFIISGGVIGLSFTHKDYRHRKINSSLTLEVARRIIEKGGKVFGETNEENVQMKRDGYEHAIGRSQIIAIY